MLLDLFRSFIDPLALMVLKLGRSNVMEAVAKADDFVYAIGEIDHEEVGQTDVADVGDNMEEEEEEPDAFIKKVETFCKEKNLEFKNPKFYGEDVDLLKLWREVTKLGGYDAVCSKKMWKQVGKSFDPPKTCTSLSFTFRQFYSKALLEYERCNLHGFETTECADSLSSPLRTADALTRTKRIRKDTKARIESKRIRSGINRSTKANRLTPCDNVQRPEGTSPSVTSSDTRTIDSSDAEVELQDNYVVESHDRSLMGHDSFECSWRKLRLKSYPRTRELNRKKQHRGTQKRSSCPTGVKEWTFRREQQECDFSLGPSPVEKLKAVVEDEYNPVEWVKINVYKTRDDFQIYALVPGLTPNELRVECEASGRVVIMGSPRQPRNLWGLTAFRKVIHLPSKIDTKDFEANVSLYGQLLLRVPFLRETQSTKRFD